MSSATQGSLVECDAALIQFVLHVDEQQKEGGKASFVISQLDDKHLLVKHEAVDMITAKIDELQRSNAFSRNDEAAPETKRWRDEAAPGRKRKKKEAS